MKKMLLFSLIGAVVIFAWQFLSHAMPNFHSAASKYTPHQGEILQKLQELNLEEGMYLLGQPDPSKSKAEQEAEMKLSENKPWAVLNYQAGNSWEMTFRMIRGFITDFFIAMILFWLFLQQKDPSLKNRVFVSIAVGFICFLFVPYTGYIWYREPDIWAYMLDAVVPWAILGLIGSKMAKQ